MTGDTLGDKASNLAHQTKNTVQDVADKARRAVMPEKDKTLGDKAKDVRDDIKNA